MQSQPPEEKVAGWRGETWEGGGVRVEGETWGGWRGETWYLNISLHPLLHPPPCTSVFSAQNRNDLNARS